MTRIASLVQAELARIAERFDAGDRLTRQAKTESDREAVEAVRRDAAGEHWAASMDLADLLLLLLRKAMQHRPDALRTYLVELLRPELDPITETITRIEAEHAPVR